MSRFSIAFDGIARRAAQAAGRPGAFLAAVGIVVVWGACGPWARYSDTWQLIINTGTTVVTFLMVFLIQASQNRDSDAMQLKIDELIRATRAARDDLIEAEVATQDERDALRAALRGPETRP